MNRREATIRYQLNADGEGVLEETNTRVRVDDRFNMERGPDIGLTLSHPNYLYVRFLDGPDCRVHEYFQETLPQYLQRIGREPTKTCFVEKDPATYVIVREDYKQIAKSIIDFTGYMHSQNVSFHQNQNLDFEYNFGVQNNTVKIWKVGFRSPATLSSRKRDFRLVAAIIEHLLQGTNPLPDGFADLVQRMRNYQDRTANLDGMPYGFNDSYLYSNHIALLTSSQRLIFFCNCRQKLHVLPSRYVKNYNDALLMMGNNQYWIQRFHKDTDPPCFKNVLSHLVDDTINVMSQRDPSFHVNYGAYFGSDEFIQDLKTQYADEGTNLVVNRSLIRMCRNLTVHLPETCTNIRHVNDEIIAGLIMHAFGQELVNFQTCLFMAGILEYFLSF